jgi:hypothetical protein
MTRVSHRSSVDTVVKCRYVRSFETERRGKNVLNIIAVDDKIVRNATQESNCVIALPLAKPLTVPCCPEHYFPAA